MHGPAVKPPPSLTTGQVNRSRVSQGIRAVKEWDQQWHQYCLESCPIVPPLALCGCGYSLGHSMGHATLKPSTSPAVYLCSMAFRLTASFSTRTACNALSCACEISPPASLGPQYLQHVSRQHRSKWMLSSRLEACWHDSRLHQMCAEAHGLDNTDPGSRSCPLTATYLILRLQR